MVQHEEHSALGVNGASEEPGPPAEAAPSPKAEPEHKTREVSIEESSESRPGWGTAYFDRQRRLLLFAPGFNQVIRLDICGNDTLLLGRFDPETGLTPDVDLTAFDAVAKGVSRQHARLDVGNHALYITDLGSTNSTYLNRVRLAPFQPRIVRDGDELSLGSLRLQVFFTRLPD